MATIPTPPVINRLVLLYDKPKYYHTIMLLKELRELENNYITVIEIDTIDKFLKETTISSVKFDHLHMCVEFNPEFEGNLQKFINFMKTTAK